MLSGCVSYETYECRIFTEERDYPLYRIEEEFGNLSADDESNSADDLFRDLLTYIEGEEFLFMYLDTGAYVRDRRLVIRDGRVYSRVTSLRKDLSRKEDMRMEGGEVILEMKKEKGLPELLETNGKVSDDAERIRIAWPEDSAEIRWKIRQYRPGEFAVKMQPFFLKKARAYTHPANRLIRYFSKGRYPGLFVFGKPPESEKPEPAQIQKAVVPP